MRWRLVAASVTLGPYWQSKEIMRVIKECNPELAGIDLRMLEYISPAEWDNLILYGEYIVKKYLIKR